jgi:hypothetical protein
MTRAELFDRISVKEFNEWRYIYTQEPWGDRRMDVLFAQLIAFLVNMMKAKHETPAKITDFLLPWWDEGDGAETVEAGQRAFDSFKALAVRQEEKGDGAVSDPKQPVGRER